MSATAIAEDLAHTRNDKADDHVAKLDLPAWISPGLMARTQDVWSRHLQRPVGKEEAATMLMNVKRLAEIIISQRRSSAPREGSA